MLWSCRRDRRLSFDPASPWTVNITANRAHGMFQPEIGSVVLSLEHQTDEGYFLRTTVIKPLAPWLEALYNRQADLILLLVFSMPVLAALLFKQSWLAALTSFSAVRLGILALVVGFIGWWGQGQLSVVTVIATIRTALEGGSFSYLLYDPFHWLSGPLLSLALFSGVAGYFADGFALLVHCKNLHTIWAVFSDYQRSKSLKHGINALSYSSILSCSHS